MTAAAHAHRRSCRPGSQGLVVALLWLGACSRLASEKVPEAAERGGAASSLSRTQPTSSASAAEGIASAFPQAVRSPPEKVDYQAVAMGTNVHFVAYTNDRVDADDLRRALMAALAEMKRLEARLSEWQADSDIGKLNASPDHWFQVGPDAFEVIKRGVEEGRASAGAFDITFQAMSQVWKFGSAAEATPKVPSKTEVERRRQFVDYRKVELDPSTESVRLPSGTQIGLGGIAKGYIVDRAAAVLRAAGLTTFLVQAGGDLYGAGRKPDGSPWVSGIQDPRAATGMFFAAIELTDHAFSTAGDYARSYIVGERRYHHIIDPHTGYPATRSRSVTVWAEDATTADAVDDAVFVLGPERGLELVEHTPGVGVVIVDQHNKVWISPRLAGKIQITRQPTDGL